jgi:FkbM family methyltransferase
MAHSARLLSLLPDPLADLLRQAHYYRRLRNASASDEGDLAMALALLRRGDAAIDVGANFGLYTRFFAEAVGPGGTVIAVEPVPVTFRVLQNNVRRLRLHNVVAVNAACSDREEPVLMRVPRIGGAENFYRAQIEHASRAQPAERVFQVQARRLDQLVHRNLRISLLKIDVEGHELKCLQGAMQLIRRWHPALLVEVNGDPDEREGAGALFELLNHLGYQAYVRSGNALARRLPGDRATNYFFLQERHWP